MADLVLTLIGPDRPGLVEALAAPIAAHGGNWLESRMAHLAGQFAGILRVEVPAEKVAELTAALDRIDALEVVVQASPPPAPAPGHRLMDLELVGLDRPGIVREISHALSSFGVNIEELVTDRSTAPMSGEPLFRARARLDVRPGVDLGALRAKLEKLAGDLLVEIKLAAPEERA